MNRYFRSTHLYSSFVALCVLVTIIVGAVVTSLERPIASIPGAQIPASAATFEFWHHMVGGVTVVLALGMALLLRNQWGWIALAAGILDGALGAVHQAFPSILHAVLAQVFFGATIAAALQSSAAWQRGPDPIEDTWRPSIRSLAITVPGMILLQTTLGAAYRYRTLSVLWHILDAMIVLLLVLIVSIFLVRQFPQHPTLRPAGLTLAIVTSTQVMLGFTTFMLLILIPDEAHPAVVITSVLHVTTGALTFGAGVALSRLIRYNARAVTGGQ